MDALIDWLIACYTATIPVGETQQLLVREIVGNVFGLASALGGMLRRVWAWPVGILGNLLLLTVFLGTLLDPSHELPALLGQAGRQIMFISVSVYGWVRWRRASADSGRIVPEWASWKQRGMLVGALLIGTVAITPLFRLLGSYEPVWADAWTFVGSLLATYGMARGWTEFWLLWIAVDVVGVPLLFSAGYWATGSMYAFYGAFTLWGFIVWSRARRKPAIERLMPDPRIDTKR